ncbi:hypothetical protein HYV89_02110 [Candidatus Woesearchaeota archaeon]|nr:hypothetical protein [Candidatus Woesearchaeota archaeon]
MKEYTISELRTLVDNSFNYLRKYFDQNVGRHNLVIVRGDLEDNILANFNVYTNRKVYVDIIKIDENKLIKKLRNGKVENNLEIKFSTALDEIIGEEIGSILFYVNHDLDKKLGLAQEVAGYYSGMIYANRNNQEPLFLRPYRNEESYGRARKLYTKFKDAKLAELALIKNLDDFNNLFSRLEV